MYWGIKLYWHVILICPFYIYIYDNPYKLIYEDNYINYVRYVYKKISIKNKQAICLSKYERGGEERIIFSLSTDA